MMCGVRLPLILGIVITVTFFSSMQLASAAEGLAMWDKKYYQIGEWATVTLQDSQKNVFNVVIDEPYILITSDSDRKGIPLRLIETEINSGIFIGKIRLSSDFDSKDSIFVKEGDGVYSHNRGYLRSAKVDSRNGFDVLPILVTTDKSSYNSGDVVTVSGSLSDGNPRTPVNLSVIDPNGKIILSQIVKPSYVLRFYSEIKTDGALWKNSGNYKIEAWHENEFVKAQTVFSFNTSHDLEDTTKSIKVLGSPFFIEYSITSGYVTLVRPVLDSNSLQFSFIPKSGGHLTVKLPQNLIDSKTFSGAQDDFAVFVDGKAGEHIEMTSANERTLTIPYGYRAKNIEIQGTFLEINPRIESGESTIPDWVRNNAEWWSKGLIEEHDFLSGMQFLINQGIIHVQDLPGTTEPTPAKIPNWVKDTAGWWASEKVSDQDFLLGIGYLVDNGVIKI